MTITLDLDGTLLNYGDHTNTRINLGLIDALPPGPLAIVTNQGGVPFSYTNPKFPTPLQVAKRLSIAITALRQRRRTVNAVLVTVYHPKADPTAIQRAAIEMRHFVSVLMISTWHVYTTEHSRKPHPLMLRAADATVYYGDSTEDAEAAAAAGIPFVLVQRFT